MHEDCNESFSESREYKAHTAQHKWGPHRVETDELGQLQFCCLFPNCNKAVSDRKVLRKHLLTHREKQFVCHYEVNFIFVQKQL